VVAALQALTADGQVDLADGLQIVPVDALVRRPFDPGMGLLIVPTTAIAAKELGTAFDPPVLPGRHGHGAEALTMLRRLYPAAHPVRRASDSQETTLDALEADVLESQPHYLSAVEPVWNAGSPHALAWLVARLRAPGGCPWDAEQDHLTLRPFLLEEAYEVYDALEGGSTPALAEELGDLLLQIVLHAQYGSEAGVFDLADVQKGIFTKIVRRHPHVFGDTTAASVDDVIRNWEQIKEGERAEAARIGPPKKQGAPDMPAAFAGLSKSLPALAYASEMQARAAGLGYDWPDLEGVIDKIAEEASELLEATEPAHIAEEFGDLLFVVVNMGRKLGIDPEASLRAASRKFAGRFARVERLAGTRGVELRALGLDALDDLWQEAKREEAEGIAVGSSSS
jgi:tetrapyrrole methylase family protein/MazG family protein